MRHPAPPTTSWCARRAQPTRSRPRTTWSGTTILAGTFGGISIAQWQKILNLPNVTVAAPIANIGYVIPSATVVVPVGPLSSSDAQQIFRVNVTWKAANGLSSYPGGTDYMYYTRRTG